MQKKQELFNKNLAFFERTQPALFVRLSNYEPLGDIVWNDEGDPDIEFEGMQLYGMGGQTYTDLQLNKFWDNPERVAITPLSSDSVDDEGKVCLYNLLKYGEDNAISYGVNRTTDHVFHLFVLGIGLGFHIPKLLERTQPQNVVLIEPNFEFIYHSLYTFDWEKMSEYFTRTGAQLNILIESDPSLVISEVRTIFRQFGPTSFDGMTVFRHYDNSLMTRIVKFISENGEVLFVGLGFFEDELNMIANTHVNLKSGKERVFYANTDPQELPVFIVGSGPSLDLAMDTIRENANRAVIISCGTALAPLLRGGVVPDFQVELERSEHQVTMPTVVADEFDLSKICLVASSTVVEEVKNPFPNRVFYFRHMLSSFPQFSNDLRNCLRHPSPTVGNAGCSLAQDLGFRELYLFGMDLGFKDGKSHHSKNAAYTELVGEFEAQWDRVAPGNFGGKVKSTHVFDWARDTLERSIDVSFQGYRYFNCSDGVMIRRTIPMLPELISIPKPSRPKTAILDDIMTGFPIYNEETFAQHWQEGDLVQQISDLGEDMIRIIENYPNLLTKQYVSKLALLVDPHGYDDTAKMILRGSLYQLILVCEYYLDRAIGEDNRKLLAQKARAELIFGIRSMCETAKVELDHLHDHGVLKERATR
jgi:hypothetical protein